MNPTINCIWSQFLKNDIHRLKSTCNLSPIQKSNYITTINKNDLFYVTITKPMILWEICENKQAKYHMNNTGFLQTKPKCMIKTDDYIIKTHDNIIMNFTADIQPFLYGSSFSAKDFINLTYKLPPLDEDIKTKIINSKSTIETLKRETKKLMELSSEEIYLKELTHESSGFSFSISLPTWQCQAYYQLDS